jgi:hypothetical protein
MPEAYIGTPDYEAAAKAMWGDSFAGESWEGNLFAMAKEKCRIESRLIVDAALAGLERVELTEETKHGCAASSHGCDLHPAMSSRWVSGWVPVTGDKTEET